MTDVVTLSTDRTADPLETGRAIRYAGHFGGWVVPNTETLLGDITELAAGPHDAFVETSSGASLTATIGTGEAVIGGTLLGRDVTTDVTLPANTAGVTVSVGWTPGTTNAIRIDRNANFAADEPKTSLYIYDTDGTGVTAANDVRTIGEQVGVKNARYETSGSGGTKVDRAEQADSATTATSADDADTVQGHKITVADTAPSSPSDGDIWIDTS